MTVLDFTKIKERYAPTNLLRMLWCRLFHFRFMWEIDYRFGYEVCCSKCLISRYQDCVWY